MMESTKIVIAGRIMEKVHVWIAFLFIQLTLVSVEAVSIGTRFESPYPQFLSQGYEDNVPSRSPSGDNVGNGRMFIQVYPWNNHLGRPGTVEWNEMETFSCKTIPQRWLGKVRSINTHGNCVVLFSRPNCEGSSKVVKVGSPSHHRLSDLCFQRKSTSVRPCTREEER